MIPVNLKGISANKNGNDYPYTVIHCKLYLMSHLVKLYYEDITIWDDSTNIYTKSWAKFKLRLNFIARLACLGFEKVPSPTSEKIPRHQAKSLSSKNQLSYITCGSDLGAMWPHPSGKFRLLDLQDLVNT